MSVILQALQQQLQVKHSDIASIKSLGSYLIDASHESLDSQQSVKDSLWGLDQNWRRLEEQTNQLESQLKGEYVSCISNQTFVQMRPCVHFQV